MYDGSLGVQRAAGVMSLLHSGQKPWPYVPSALKDGKCTADNVGEVLEDDFSFSVEVRDSGTEYNTPTPLVKTFF